MKMEGSAHGKAILFGEHAVVYGIPAIAVGIERGARASALPIGAAGTSTLRIRSGGSFAVASDSSREWNVPLREDEPDAPAARAFADLLAATRAAGVALGAVAVDAEADLPPVGGLGCSAALGVAIARALDQDATDEVIAERAGAWEGVFHGNASGVDAAVASLGGCVLFERGGADKPSTITRIRVPAPMSICIGNTGQASSTRSMVEGVARLRERRPDTTQKTFDAIHTLVRNARLAIEAADRNAIGQLLDLNQMLLSGLFLSTPEIEQMCGTARAAGALGAKFTGAGGGGCVVALVDRPEIGTKVLSAWKSDGFDGFLTTFGAATHARSSSRVLEDAP